MPRVQEGVLPDFVDDFEQLRDFPVVLLKRPYRLSIDINSVARATSPQGVVELALEIRRIRHDDDDAVFDKRI